MTFLKYTSIVIFVILISCFISAYIERKKLQKPILQWWVKIYRDKITLILIVLLAIIEYLLLRKYDFTIEFIINSMLFTLLLSISLWDIKNKTIPNLMIAIGAIISIISVLLSNDIAIYNAILGALIPGVFLGLTSLITKGALGMGDAKLFVIVGLFVGLKSIFAVLFLSTLLIGIISLVLLTFRVVNRKTTIPFAPFIFVATLMITLL